MNKNVKLDSSSERYLEDAYFHVNLAKDFTKNKNYYAASRLLKRAEFEIELINKRGGFIFE